MPSDERKLNENDTWNRLSKWEMLIDEQVRRVIGDGDMSWHPGAGKPLPLEDDNLVPEDQRLAQKIMKDNNAVPAWMALAFTLRDKRDKIMQRALQHARDYVRRSHDALSAGSFVRDQHARDRWLEATRRLRHDIRLYNTELLDYNLQIPPQIGQMIPLDAGEIINGALRQAQQELADKR